jgi:hypothetical protein
VLSVGNARPVATNGEASGIGAGLWVQLAQPSVLVHRVNPSMSRMVSSPRKAIGYGAARFPLLEVQQVRQLDPSVTRSHDPVRSQPPVAVRCIWSTYSWSASAGPDEPRMLGLEDCEGVEFGATGEGVLVAREAARKLTQAPAPAIPARIATMATAAMARFRNGRRPR